MGCQVIVKFNVTEFHDNAFSGPCVFTRGFANGPTGRNVITNLCFFLLLVANAPNQRHPYYFLLDFLCIRKYLV